MYSFEDGTLSFSEAAEQRAKSYEQGRVLLTQLVATARDLKLRCVGKNYDDANELFGGLESLLEQVAPIHWTCASSRLLRPHTDPQRGDCESLRTMTEAGQLFTRSHLQLRTMRSSGGSQNRNAPQIVD